MLQLNKQNLHFHHIYHRISSRRILGVVKNTIYSRIMQIDRRFRTNLNIRYNIFKNRANLSDASHGGTTTSDIKGLSKSHSQLSFTNKILFKFNLSKWRMAKHLKFTLKTLPVPSEGEKLGSKILHRNSSSNSKALLVDWDPMRTLNTSHQSQVSISMQKGDTVDLPLDIF